MRIVNPHLLAEKMDEAVTHYINSHQQSEQVHVDGTLTLNMQDEAGRVVTIMPGQGFTTQMNRQVPVSDHVENTPWNEELLDPDMRLAQLVAQLTHQSRHSQQQSKLSSEILGTPLRLFNGQTMDTQPDSIVVPVPSLPPLPTLQDMKRCPETDWFSKDKNTIKENAEILAEADGQIIELNTGTSPAQNKQQNKKSLPHKKRISRKLKRHNNGSSTSQQQDVVVINYHEDVQHEEILPDNFVTGVQHEQHLTDDTHHITQEVRPILICQLCGEFYGEDQLKFYQHLKQHYEPHATIIIENPVSDLAIDKMANSCIVDNGAALPDSIVELSLENTVPKTMYQPMDKHILYTTTDKTLYTNKVQYSIAGMEKEPVPVSEAEKVDIYDTLDKLELYNCGKCNKSFRKQKQCEAHVKEAHGNTKLEEMGEFSEPEDLMEGIHVEVEEAADQYEQSLLPHITVDNGHVHQEHPRHWYMRPGGGGLAACGADGGYCPLCAARPHADAHTQLKEEVLQRIFDSEVGADQSFADNIIQESELTVEPELEQPEAEAEPEPDPGPKTDPVPEDKTDGKKKNKKCECEQCGRVFYHRNSLMYHLLSHREKQYECKECGKEFYTTNALKVHKRVHSNDRPYKCEECGREFRQWSDLKYHKVSRHSNQKLFKCEFCGKEFARKYSLNVHRRIHTGEKNYKCEYCNKTFRASSYRLTHMRVHTGDRPFKCTTCEKAFRVPGDLRRHMLTHEKYRKRFDELKDHIKPKEEVVDPKNKVKTDTKPDLKELEQITSKVKKIAVASTSRPPLLKNVDKKPKPPKKPTNKKGAAPNVTVMDVKRNGEQFKMIEIPNNVEVYDTRQELTKYKQVYESNVDFNKDGAFKPKEYNEQIYKDGDDRDLATLRPTMFRGSVCESDKVYSRNDNTDGKMQVFTHVERGAQLAGGLSDIRGIERERAELHGETIENGFLENLTALYNIPAV